MTNVDTTAKPKKVGVAKHEFINASGKVVGINQGIGIRYTDKASGKVFEFPIPGAAEHGAGKPLTMFALFGAKTKATNETSRLRNGDGGVTDPDEQIGQLDTTFGKIGGGHWPTGEGVGQTGSRADKPTLAAALVEALGTGAKMSAEEYAAKMESDADYTAKVFGNKAVKAIYLAMRAKAGAAESDDTLDDLA